MYTKWCIQTFLPVSLLFAIFDSNFAKIVAPPCDENWESVICLNRQSLLKKGEKWKQNQNRPINLDTMLVLSMCLLNKQCGGLWAWQTGGYTNTIFSHLQPMCIVRSPPNVAWWRRNIVPLLKGDSHFSIQCIVFPTGCKMLIFGYRVKTYTV